MPFPTPQRMPTSPPSSSTASFSKPFVVLAGAVALVIGSLVTIPGTWGWFLGLLHLSYPFYDLHAVFSAGEAHQLGFSVFHENPLDSGGRVHGYARWWLVTGYLGLTRADEIWFGLALNGLFISGALFLLRPHTWRQAAIAFLVICSPATLLGVERANNDLLIFLLLLPVPWLFLSSGRARQILGCTVLFFATALKYYPVMGYLLVIRSGRDLRGVLITLGLCAAAVAAYVFAYLDDFAILRNTLPRPYAQVAFGAWLLPAFVGVPGEFCQMIAWAGFIAAAAACLWVVFRSPMELPRGTPWQEHSFLLGAGILVFCFFITSNYDYRCIYLFFTLPYLWQFRHLASTGPIPARAARAIIAAMIVAMWIEPLYFHLIARLFVFPSYQSFYDTLQPVLTLRQVIFWCLVPGLMLFAALILKPSLLRLAAGKKHG